MNVSPPIDRPGRIAAPDMSRSYDDYFETGLYERRYPAPNRRVLRLATNLLPRGGRFLDYGVGTGRYCLPLIRDTGASCVAFDISPVALAQLAHRHPGLVTSGRLALAGPGHEDLDAAVARDGRFDLALLAFGVLGHVAGHRRRINLLAAVSEMLVPGGRVLLSVPNALRRFRQEQRDAVPAIAAGRLEPGDILYRRATGDHEIDLYYHLYGLDELRHDIGESGLAIETTTAESVLSEHAVVCHPLVGRIDDLVSDWLPVRLAYGFLVIARKA